MVRASASGAVDLGLIPSRVKLMTLKLVFKASLLDAQHQRDSAENKHACSLIVPLGRALSGITPSWCGRQMAGTQWRTENFKRGDILSTLFKRIFFSAELI